MTAGWTWFFAWVGLAAFVLTIPMSIAGNLATEKLRHWWATTSMGRREKRIEELKFQLYVYETFNAERRDDALSLGLRALGLSLLYGFVLIMSEVMITVLAAMDTLHVGFGLGPSLFHSVWTDRFFVGLNALGMLYFYICFVRTVYRALSYLRRVSPTSRRIEIDSIKLELRSLGIELNETFGAADLKNTANQTEGEPEQ